MLTDFFSKEIIVFLLGAAPVSEVRGAIPVGMLVFGFPVLKTYILATLGNITPVIPLLLFLDRFSKYLMKKSLLLNNFFNWLFERTRVKHSGHFDKWKYAPLALFIFVAIPVPLTGAWSGVIAAIIFGIPFFEAAVSISLGVAVAGVLVVLLTSLGILTASQFML
ncbi:MAG: small multi-drug export protein [bacterium]